MTLDEELLKKAQAAGAKLAEAEHQALTARADYHTMIRRMHLAGGTFREIGQALGLSHQRVQQIVDAAGGSWWSRIWKNRNVRRDAVCTFCGKPPSEIEKLLAGPDVYICDGCVGRAEKGGFGGGRSARRARCSFCRKPGSETRPVVVAPEASVCTECLGVCRQILDDRSGGQGV
jgi:hypothetical protein